MNNKYIKPIEIPISKIFSDNIEYKIPIYQRNYAWKSVEIEQLLDDINGIRENKYYIGNLIVDEIETNSYMVIDGQQRLTTLFLILIYLDGFNVHSNSLSFEARDKSNKILKFLYENKKIPDDIDNDDLINGYKIIKEYFSTFSEEQKAKFKNKLKNISIIRTLVPKNIDLNHYFEIMNTRGEQLEIHEIAKAKILSIISNSVDKKIAADIWDACSQMNTYIQMNFNPKQRKTIFPDKWNNFPFKDFKELSGCLTSTLGELNSNKSSLFNIIYDKENKEIKEEKVYSEGNERFDSIVSFPNFLLIVSESLNSEKAENDSLLDDKNFIDNMRIYWENEQNALNFIFNLLRCRFLFDKYIIKREYIKNNTEEGQWSLKLLQEYKDENQSKPEYVNTFNETNREVLTLQSALRITYTSPKTMHWISKVLSFLLNNCNIDAISLKSLLESYARNKVKEADYENARGFGIARIVFTYLDYILFRDNEYEFKDFQFQFRNSIEHFYPQHPELSDCWEEKYLNSFGNLALLTVSANSKFSNLKPSMKAEYKEIIKQSPKLKRMIDKMEKDRDWTTDKVNEHKFEMIELLKKDIN